MSPQTRLWPAATSCSFLAIFSKFQELIAKNTTSSVTTSPPSSPHSQQSISCWICLSLGTQGHWCLEEKATQAARALASLGHTCPREVRAGQSGSCKAGIGRTLGVGALGCGSRVVERASGRLSALCSCVRGRWEAQRGRAELGKLGIQGALVPCQAAEDRRGIHTDVARKWWGPQGTSLVPPPALI